MKAVTKIQAGLLGVASAAALSLASAPAQATALTQQATTAAAPSTVQRAAAVFGQAAAKRAKWVTLKHQSKRVNSWSVVWDRKYGHRVMQVKARCWGKGRTMNTAFEYRNRWRPGGS
ncbi:hypothetical protein ACQP2T_42845 [Nonomuraea sp. CA-143628]|uniref:hypothetical protein n=1 Tax=Nonomuraea sp. CA-143628 TaxID=3239997 RepID=UPI003D8DD84C